MTDNAEDPPLELLEIWRQLDETRRASLLRVARALADAVQEEKEAGEQIIRQDGGGAGIRAGSRNMSVHEGMVEHGTGAASAASGTSPTQVNISEEQRALASIILRGIKAGASPYEIAAMILSAGYRPQIISAPR